MSPRVQASKTQKRLRTPRIPFLLFHFDLVSKALTKGFFLFDQSFFIRLFQFKLSLLKLSLLKNVFSQYYICFPTSV